MEPARSSESAFTLIEFLVAIVILMVGMLGLLQMVNVSLNHNLQNQLRNEAVNVLDAEMSKEIAKGYNAGAITVRNYTASRQILGAYKLYSVAQTGSTLQNSRQVGFQVSWRHKGIRYTHEASSVLTNSNQ
ncbi:MAG TPA: prepilin-type N-terminal cleavage/methylation domain-containing protein [Desulfuromonadaceae bacterium]|jgi:type IV pilus assembly protein PilV